jgi:hypothetical protein
MGGEAISKSIAGRFFCGSLLFLGQGRGADSLLAFKAD